VRAAPVDPPAAQPDAAARRPLQPHPALPAGALPGPVRADAGDVGAVVDSERDAVDGRETAEALRDVVDLEKQVRLRATTVDGTGSAAGT
jgi:hypothetical protein